MAKLTLEIGKTYTVALKYSKGKFYESTFPGQDGSLMYSLQSGDVVFLPENADELFAERNIGAGEPFTIARKKTKQKGEYFEIHKLSDASEPQLDPSRYPDEQGRMTTLETKLVASIAREQQRKATPVKVLRPAAAPVAQPHANAAGTTRASSAMASAMIAAFDAGRLFEQYAASKGVVVTCGMGDFRAIAATIYIQNAEDARVQGCDTGAFEAGVNGGTAWQQ